MYIQCSKLFRGVYILSAYGKFASCALSSSLFVIKKVLTSGSLLSQYCYTMKEETWWSFTQPTTHHCDMPCLCGIFTRSSNNTTLLHYRSVVGDATVTNSSIYKRCERFSNVNQIFSCEIHQVLRSRQSFNFLTIPMNWSITVATPVKSRLGHLIHHTWLGRDLGESWDGEDWETRET